jgi:hypothetical protein
VQLFNGQDLKGWKYHPDQPGDWKVENQHLVGSGRRSHLFSERGDYENFYLRFEAKVNAAGDGGVFFRAPFQIRPQNEGAGIHGYEAQIHAEPGEPGVPKTGTLMLAGPPLGGLGIDVAPDTWFTGEILAVGNRITIKVNGITTAEFENANGSYAKGHIALQIWEPNTVVEFRRIEIKELPAAPINWLDLGPLVDPEADALAGKWKLDGETLVCEGAGVPFARLALPVRPIGDYEMEVEFTRTQGLNGPILNLPVGGRPVQFAMDSGATRFTALELVDRLPVDRDDNPTNNKEVRIDDNKRYKLVVRVQTQDDTAKIQADLDGKRILDWTGKCDRLSITPGWSLGDDSRPGLHPWGLDIRYHSVKLRMLSGEAKLVRP